MTCAHGTVAIANECEDGCCGAATCLVCGVSSKLKTYRDLGDSFEPYEEDARPLDRNAQLRAHLSSSLESGIGCEVNDVSFPDAKMTLELWATSMLIDGKLPADCIGHELVLGVPNLVIRLVDGAAIRVALYGQYADLARAA